MVPNSVTSVQHPDERNASANKEDVSKHDCCDCVAGFLENCLHGAVMDRIDVSEIGDVVSKKSKS